MENRVLPGARPPRKGRLALGCLLLSLPSLALSAEHPAPALPSATGEPTKFFDAHCYDCHDADEKKGGLDLTALQPDFANAENFSRWVKVFDRVETGDMPPKKKPRPPKEEAAAAMKWLRDSLLTAEGARLKGQVRTGVHRFTRAEYENTVRDLFDLPGIALAGDLPADGTAHGFDKNSDALNISHVNLAKYVEAADHTLDLAIATQPKAPTIQKRRISLANPAGFVANITMNGDGVLLKKQADRLIQRCWEVEGLPDIGDLVEAGRRL